MKLDETLDEAILFESVYFTLPNYLPWSRYEYPKLVSGFGIDYDERQTVKDQQNFILDDQSDVFSSGSVFKTFYRKLWGKLKIEAPVCLPSSSTQFNNL